MSIGFPSLGELIKYRKQFYLYGLVQMWFSRYLPSLTIAAFVGGVLLRIAGLTTSSIWYDEAFSVYLTRLPLLDMVRAAGSDFNPPLWELVLWPLTRLFGDSELAIRLPALIFSLISLALIWKLTDVFQLTKAQALAAMVLASLLPYQFWMAQDARCYALLEVLFLGGIYFAISRRITGLIACTGLLLYTHATGIFFSITLIGIAWWNSRKVTQPGIGLAAQSRLKSLLNNDAVWVAAPTALAFLPWVPYYFHASGLSFWNNPLGPTFLDGLVMSWWAFTIRSEALALLFLAILLLSILAAIAFTLEPIQNHTWRTSPLISLGFVAVTPFLLMLATSLAYKNIIYYRTLSPLVLPCCLWFGATITPRRLTRTTWIMPFVWLVLIIISLVGWSPTAKGGSLRDQAVFISSQIRSGDVIYHATGTTALPFDYYLPSADSYVLDVQQDDGLLQTSLQKSFGIHRGMLETIPYQRAWIVWAKDPTESIYAQNRMADYTQGATLIGVVHGWQFSEIEIYLKESK